MQVGIKPTVPCWDGGIECDIRLGVTYGIDLKVVGTKDFVH